MELTLDQALQKGIEAHKAGQVQEADRIYTAILKAQPKHPDANHNMGVLAVGVGKVQEALPFFKTALESNPNTAQFWLSYIDALIKLERLADATAVFDEAKYKGAKGDVFDKLERRLEGVERTAPMGSHNQDPAQDHLQPSIELYRQGQLKQALDNVEKLLQSFPNSVTLYNIQGAASQGLGQFDAAVESYSKAIIIKPDYAQTYNNIGFTFHKQGLLGEAVEAFNKALALEPNYAEAYNNMANALQEQGKLEEAIGEYNKALAIKPDYADACYNMGITLQEQGKLEEAIEAYNRALALKPDYADACYNAGNALQEQGKLEEAIEAYNRALALKPDYAEAYNNAGNALQKQGKLEEAIEAYNRALALKPDYAEAYNNAGSALKEQGKLEEAIEAYNKALALKLDYAEAYNNMGNALQEQGKLEGAIEAYNKALVFKPDYAEAHRNLSTLIRYKPNDLHIIAINELMKRPDLKDSDRCNLFYTFAKMNEDLGHLGAAYENYVAGGALRQKLLAYNQEQDQRLFAKIKGTALSLKNFAFDPPSKELAHTPIFILGMPRSGTTLVEQIISCHSKVQGAGELLFIDRFGGSIAIGAEPITTNAIIDFQNIYLDELLKVANGKHFVTDKMPHNFQYIGLILKVFPEAKIIHVKRDSAATCWSNFKHYFIGNGLGYSYDLNETVRYFKLYQDLMSFWDQLYGVQIYHLDYDRLTNEQEPETRKLIEHLELGWEDACLSPQENKRSVRTASQQQVREKVYTGSSQAWYKFEPYLNGVFDELKTS